MSDAPRDSVAPAELIVAEPFAERLQAAGWTSFESLWNAAESGKLVRDLRPLRFTSRVEFPDGCGAVYIKCHVGDGHGAESDAHHEWTTLQAVSAAGVAVPAPVAVGRHGGRSLLAMAAIEDCIELCFRVLEPKPTATEWRAYVEQLADTTRTLHTLGWSHQDLYLAHFLVPLKDVRPLWLLDWHRARQRLPFPWLWRMKDLAQLEYSAQAAHIARGWRLRFWRRYLGRNPTWRDRWLEWAIRWKASRIARHAARHDGDTAMAGR